MPTKNFVSDFGGVGDGQRQTVNITVSSGSPTLTVDTAIFVSGDVGKAISVWNGSNSKNVATISGFTSSTVVTLNSNFSWSATASSSDVLWGTDNTSAFTGASGSWRAYAITQTNPADIPILQIPDGNYCANIGGFNPLHEGVLNSVTVSGLSGTAANCKLMQLGGGEFRFGSNIAIAQHGLVNVGGNSARLQTTTAGASTAALVDPTTYGSRIVVGRSCLIAAFDMQSLNEKDYGYPPNSFFFEWNVISGYNSGTGVVTFENPLTQVYKSTYPRWGLLDTDFGSGGTQGSDQGGPATIWVAPDGYNNTVTMENMTIDSPHNQSAIHRRHWVGNNLIMNGPGMYPTQNDTVTLNNCVYPQQLEIDKMTNQVTWNNCTIRKLQQQSASPNKMTINGGTIDSLETCKFTECNNVAFTNEASIIFGVSAYGRTDRVILNGCSGINILQKGGAGTDDLGGNTSAFYTFDSGVLKALKTSNDGTSGRQNITRLFVPGTWIRFDDKYIDQIDDVYEDGTYCYIRFKNTTDWPFTPVIIMRAHPCPDLTVTGCTGTAVNLDDFQLAPNRSPAYSYSKRTYVGGPSSATVISPANSPTLLGRFVSEKINVTTAYTGAGSLSLSDSQFLNRTYVKRSDWTTSATFGSSVNAKITGERVIRAATTATGAQTSDSLENMTTPGEVNFTGTAASGVIWSANVTNGETPTITVEYIMDHGIPSAVPTAVAPLRLRLRAA